MKREILSPGQWGCLLWAAGLAPACELLPGVALELAGRAAWLSPLAAALILLPVLWLCRRGSVEVVGQSLLDKVILGVLALWMVILLALRLGLCARRMLWSGERDGAVWYFLLTLAALSLWMGQGKLTALGRAGQIFLVLLLLAAGLVLGLSLPQLRMDRVLPVWTGDVVPVLKAGVGTAGCVSWAVLPVILLPRERLRRRDLWLWGVGGCLLLTVAQVILLGNLGVGLAGASDSAFFALTKSVGVEGAFQRVESVVAALWMLSDLTLCVGLLHAIRLCVETLYARLPEGTAPSLALLVAAGIALWLTRQGMPLEVWNREWIWLADLVLCVGTAAWLRWRASFVKMPNRG